MEFPLNLKVLGLILALLFSNYNTLNSITINSSNPLEMEKQRKTINEIKEDCPQNIPKLCEIVEDPWWNSSFLYRQLINITNDYPIDLVNQGINLTFNYTQLVAEGKIQDDLEDIRIVENGVLRNYYYIKNFPENDYVTIWFEIDILAGIIDYDTYLYYGNMTVGKAIIYFIDERFGEAWYRFENSVEDSSGNNNDGLIGGDPEWTTPKIENYSLEFDGIGDYVQIPDSAALSPRYEISISFWVYLTGGSQAVIRKNSRDYIFEFGTNGNNNPGTTPQFYVRTSSGAHFIYGSGAYAALQQNQWYHCVGTYNYQTGSKMYINGQQATIAVGSSSLGTIYNENSFLRLGNWAGEVFRGRIDDVRIFNHTLTSNELAWIYSFNRTLDAKLNYLQSNLKVNAIDLYENYIPFANISIYKGPFSGTPLQSKIADSEGSATFTGLGNSPPGFNISVSISSNTIKGYSEVVNTTSYAFPLTNKFREINLTCDVSKNLFSIVDVDRASIGSGWIIVGNGTSGFGEIQNCTIGTDGKTTFWWINSTPYEYNYTAYYLDDNYFPNKIILAAGTIKTPNTQINLTVNLTTINFTVFERFETTKPIENIVLRLNANNSNGPKIVDLITDINGRASLRWWNSSGLDVNGNYSLECIYFNTTQSFNMTIFRTGTSNFESKDINFTVTAYAAYDIWVDVNPDLYSTGLISLNPDEPIEVKFGIQLKIRTLFNISSVGREEQLGFINADIMTYKVIRGTTTVLLGTMLREEWNIGRHQGIIDTSILEGGKTYFIRISAQKKSYKSPDDLDIPFSVLKNDMVINQSENDDAPTEVYWLEIANMTVRPYGLSSESFIIEDTIFKESNNDGFNFEFTIPNLYTNWNLSHINFNVYNVTHGAWDDLGINITGPYGQKHTWNKEDTDNYYWYSNDATNGTWIDLRFDLHKQSPTNDNNFNLNIEGSFTGPVDVIAEAAFVRDKINVQYSKSNVSDSIIILPDGNGWVIKNITFEISNCYKTSDWTLYDLSALNALNITTNSGYKYSLDSGTALGTGILTIDDRMIFPISHLDNKFSFSIENHSNIVFDVLIKVEYIQEFYQNQYLENLNSSLKVNNLFSGSNIQISPDVMGWNEESNSLFITNLKNGTGDYIFPSKVGMNITIGVQTSTIQDGLSTGEGTFSLQGLTKNIILSALIQANQSVTFNLTFKISYSRNIYYRISATITYEIIVEGINGPASYISEFEYYQASIDTFLIDTNDYTVRFYAISPNCNDGAKDLDLDVMERLTLINGQTSPLFQSSTIFIKEAINFTFQYTDALLGINITNLDDQSYDWYYYGWGITILDSGSGNLLTSANNEYIIDFDTNLRSTGRYYLSAILDKNNYEAKFVGISLIIKDMVFLNKSLNNIINLTIELGVYLEIQNNEDGYLKIKKQEMIFTGIENPSNNINFIYYYLFEIYNLTYVLNHSILDYAKVRLYYNQTDLGINETFCLLKYIEEGNWMEIGLTVNRNQNYIEFTTSTFSVYVLGKILYIDNTPVYSSNGGDNGEKKPEDNITVIILIIAIASIIGISAAGIYYFLTKNKMKRIKQIKQ